ncbi:MAG: pyridoxal-phosphate dependent enzyme [Chloroflexi bacterium]|nr:pyridoxal-phosphate dependent enzyme [Chloroflexota bacterium]
MTGGAAFDFRCIGCGSAHPASILALESACCRLPFRVEYSTPPSSEAPRLPLATGSTRVTLGEGRTPLVEIKKTAAALGLGRLWAKLEFQSATGSFKDRGSAVLASAAIEAGVAEFVEDSSGNAGASIAAYAAAAGLKAHVFVPASAARGKLDQISIFGAALHPVEGPRQAATEAARKFATDRALPYLSHNLSPYFSEGMKSFAYEIAGSAAAGSEHVIVPVGNGSLLVGAFRGFEELGMAGGRAVLPRLHAVQAMGVRPIVLALAGAPASEPMPTIANGIAVSRPPRLKQVVDAVRASDGSGVAVGDEAILAWQRRLAATEGIFCEATSAAVLAGLETLIYRGTIGRGAEVLVPITGSGLKEPVRH